MRSATLLLLLCSCASPRVTVRGELELALDAGALDQLQISLSAQLERASLHPSATVTVDRSFEAQGFSSSAPPLRLTPGEDQVLLLEGAAARLMLRIFALPEDRPLNLSDGDFVPYLHLRQRLHGRGFVALCKGGRGRVVFQKRREGRMQLNLHCRTYVDNAERAEITLQVVGTFSANVP